MTSFKRRNSRVFYDIEINGEELVGAEDLSVVDRHHIRSLAKNFIFENLASLGISFKERTNENSKKSSSPWGMSLEDLLKRDHTSNHPNARIPILYDEIFNCLEGRGIQVEGILRIPGAAARIRSLRDHLEKQHDAATDKFEWGDGVRVNDVAALMKQFLRELPQPLLTNEWVGAFVVVGKIDNEEEKKQLLNYLVLALSDVHKDCLKRLLLFLDRVVENEEHNKMSLSSVATIMAPNLFLPPRINRQSRSYKIKKSEVDLAKDTAPVVEMLIRHHNELWTVPEALMDTLRLRYASRSEPAIPIKKMICGCFSSLGPKSREEEPANHRSGASQQVRLVTPRDTGNTTTSNTNTIGSGGGGETYLQPDEDAVISVLSRKASLARTVTSLHLETSTTASQVVGQFCRLHGVERLLSTTPEETRPRIIPGLSSLYQDPEEPFKLYLYEQGGNVGERRLHPDTNVRDALNKNPHATWIVKNRLQTTK